MIELDQPQFYYINGGHQEDFISDPQCLLCTTVMGAATAWTLSIYLSSQEAYQYPLLGSLLGLVFGLNAIS